MTPETYMRRYHTGCREEELLTAEELFPACPLVTTEVEAAGCSCLKAAPEPAPTCCCKASMVEALRLLCNAELSTLVDFDSFFFLTSTLAVGGSLTVPAAGADNISGLEASFQRFSPCNCDLIDVGGSAYFTTPGATTLALEEVEQLSLRSVKALAFGLTLPTEPEETEATVYRRALRHLRRAIQANGGTVSGCGSCGAHCDYDNCCCDEGLLAELATRNLSRLVTLGVGPLILRNVTVLGSVGSALILADETLRRIYFVCVSQVEALG